MHHYTKPSHTEWAMSFYNRLFFGGYIIPATLSGLSGGFTSSECITGTSFQDQPKSPIAPLHATQAAFISASKAVGLHILIAWQ